MSRSPQFAGPSTLSLTLPRHPGAQRREGGRAAPDSAGAWGDPDRPGAGRWTRPAGLTAGVRARPARVHPASPRAPCPRSHPGTAEALFKAAQLTLQPYAVHFVSGTRLRRGKTIPSVSAPSSPGRPHASSSCDGARCPQRKGKRGNDRSRARSTQAKPKTLPTVKT